MNKTRMLLVRVVFAKMVNRDRCVEVICGTPIRAGEPGWTCKGWVKECVERLEADGECVGTRVTDWQTIHDKALEYVTAKKAAHRYDGKAEEGLYDIDLAPTWDLLEDMEIVP